jgi:UDP-N-acetylglucosamine/UDP-N-acetylgalactosamine 4-epimerase
VTAYEKLQRALKRRPRKWLVTGAAGFIGSHLVETLLCLNQRVVGLDNFATGYAANLNNVRANVTTTQRRAFRFIEGDITNAKDCQRACRGVELVLHQAALGSVPRSFADPLGTHAPNTTGFLNILQAARKAKTQRVVYASSSSVYGDVKSSPKVEAITGTLLSPYAVSKMVDELYAQVFSSGYGQELVGLRYFNVFGPRQDPAGAYAAVIPRWTQELFCGKQTEIYGDGKTSRDFCFVANVVQANLLAATATAAAGNVYNVAVGTRTTLSQLHRQLRKLTGSKAKPVHHEFRAGDVRHSLASICAATRDLGYAPTHTLGQGLALTVPWFVR